MLKIKQLFEKYISPTYTTTFDPLIYSSRDDFIKTKSKLALFNRKLKRDLKLLGLNQFKLWRKSITKNDKKILWIINERPIGDFLMETSGRLLFRNRPHEIHIFADEHFRALFANDDVIQKFISDPEELKNETYDLILLHSFTKRIFNKKIKYFRRTPFVTTNGYFIGPSLNESLLSHYTIANMLGIETTNEEAQRLASPYVLLSEEMLRPFEFISKLTNPIVIALGGKWPWKTYSHWQELIRLLEKSGLSLNLLLVGSGNGEDFALEILNQHYADNLKIHNYVGKTSLVETACILKFSQLVVCADGGLLHLANAVQASTISLFSQYVDPYKKLTQANHSVALYSPNNVSEIPASTIAETIISSIGNPVRGVKIHYLSGDASS